MVKINYYEQNGGMLPKDPPDFMRGLARNCYRKIAPFLESTGKVVRIDIHLVELYCSNYEIYRKAYEDVAENGIQKPIYKTLQNQMGEIIGQDFAGYKKNPAVQTMKEASEQLTKIGRELGLSPKSRSELLKVASSSAENNSSVVALKDFFG